MKVLIIGAGSIGNHLAQAARVKGWEVTVCDTNPEALRRMREDIYPARYREWDNQITQAVSSVASLPGADYDVIMVGTPPDSHLKIAFQALKLEPRILHIEKPLGTPLDDFVAFKKECDEHPHVIVTVGYDHAVSDSVDYAIDLISINKLGNVSKIESMTLEHWKGIFNAHPWLAGPQDSYLGFWRRGGGALCEHSHALHLGLVIAEAAGWGELTYIEGVQDIFSGDHGTEYDQSSRLRLYSSSDNQCVLNVYQDVTTEPTVKKFNVMGDKGSLEVSFSPTLDKVSLYIENKGVVIKEFPKTRPTDFFRLMQHYEEILKGQNEYNTSPIRLQKGIEVMEFISKALGVSDSVH